MKYVFVFSFAILMSLVARAEEIKPKLCLKVGDVANGGALSIKIYSDAKGSDFAIVQKVVIWHQGVIDQDDKSRIKFPVETKQYEGGTSYSADSFELWILSSVDASTQELGSIRATYEGVPINAPILRAYSSPHNDFCETVE